MAGRPIRRVDQALIPDEVGISHEWADNLQPEIGGMNDRTETRQVTGHGVNRAGRAVARSRGQYRGQL